MIRSRELLAHIDQIKREIISEILIEKEFSKLSQSQFAKKTGLSQPDASNLFACRRLERFTLDRLVMILIKFGLKPSVYVL